MPAIIKEIKVDVSKLNVFQAIVAKQYDSDSRFLKVTITNNDEKILVPLGAVVTINARRKDNESKAFAGTVNEDGTVTVPLASWMLKLDDKVECDVSIVDQDSKRLTTTLFEINVEHAVYNGGDISQDENYDLLVQLLADVSESKTAELGRVAAETDRVTSETARAEAETVRIESETARATAEINRASAETERAAAEVLRQEEYAKMAPATESATTAANTANAAAESANEVVNQIDTLLSQHADQPYETVAGESIHIEDGAGGRAKSIAFAGNSRQKSTAGKNLLNDVGLNLQISGNDVISNKKSINLTAGTYSASMYFSDGTAIVNANAVVTLYTSTSENALKACASGTSITINDNDASQITRVAVYCNQTFCADFAGKTITRAQLERSSATTAYETYTGGISSPNPLYPQAIETVQGPITGKICGKNLFAGLVKGKMISTAHGGEYTLATAATSDYILIDISKNYYLSGLLSTLYSLVTAYDADKNYVGFIGAVARSTCAINNTMFTQSATGIDISQIKYIRIVQYEHASTAGVINDIDNARIQLEVGTAATAYLDYAAQNFTIPLIAAPSQNLFSYATAIVNNGTFDSTGKFTGTTTGNTGTSFYVKYQKMLNNVYISTYSNYVYNAGHAVFTVTKDDSIDAIRISLHGNVAQCYFVVQLPAAAGEYTLSFDLLSISVNSMIINNVKLHKGAYEAYEGAIELCKIKNVPEKIMFENGVWIYYKPVQKIVFNGNQTMITSVANNNRYFMHTLSKYADTTIATSTNLMSSHYKAANGALDGYCYISGYGKQLYMYDNRFTTVAEFDANLAAEYAAGHPVTIYYLLNEPERIILCDEAQTALNALAAASLPAGTVNMMTSNDPAPTLELEYRQDLKAFIVKVINETLAVQ